MAKAGERPDSRTQKESAPESLRGALAFAGSRRLVAVARSVGRRGVDRFGGVRGVIANGISLILEGVSGCVVAHIVRHFFQIVGNILGIRLNVVAGRLIAAAGG